VIKAAFCIHTRYAMCTTRHAKPRKSAATPFGHGKWQVQLLPFPWMYPSESLITRLSILILICTPTLQIHPTTSLFLHDFRTMCRHASGITLPTAPRTIPARTRYVPICTFRQHAGLTALDSRNTWLVRILTHCLPYTDIAHLTAVCSICTVIMSMY
jgi:hypothetical protein